MDTAQRLAPPQPKLTQSLPRTAAPSVRRHRDQESPTMRGTTARWPAIRSLPSSFSDVAPTCDPSRGVIWSWCGRLSPLALVRSSARSSSISAAPPHSRNRSLSGDPDHAGAGPTPPDHGRFPVIHSGLAWAGRPLGPVPSPGWHDLRHSLYVRMCLVSLKGVRCRRPGSEGCPVPRGSR